MSTFISGLSSGFILAPLALGIYISFRILRFPDITVDGSFGLGAVVSALFLMAGTNPVLASLYGMCAGAIAGVCTGVLIVRFGIQKLLAGILLMIALYSINLYILGQGVYQFNDEVTLLTYAEDLGAMLYGSSSKQVFLGMFIYPTKVASLLMFGTTTIALCTCAVFLFRTRFGLALRGAGSSVSAIRAVGANDAFLVVAALAISNALAALSGALLAQELGSAVSSSGMGMIVTGLAFVLIGDALFGRRSFSMRLVGAAVGALLFQSIIAFIMRSIPSDTGVRLITAGFVLAALVLPRFFSKRSAQGAQGVAP